MPVPIQYRRSGEGNLINYSFTDVAEGTGVIHLYGVSTTISGAAITFALVSDIMYSPLIETRDEEIGADWNFDLTPFNTPRVAKGNAIVRFSSGGSVSPAHYWTVNIKKVSGGNITTIGTTVTSEILVHTIKNNLVKVNLTQTNFKIGDFLRVNMNVHEESGPEAVDLAHDPANRDGTIITPAATYPTKFEVWMPFRIDL